MPTAVIQRLCALVNWVSLGLRLPLSKFSANFTDAVRMDGVADIAGVDVALVLNI